MEAKYTSATGIIDSLPISRTTFYRWIKEGKIKPKMVGTVKSYEVKKIKALLNVRTK